MDENKTNINWYPGHMYRAKREIKNDLKLVDVVVEILDARIPLSSRNPDIREIIENKKCLVVLNKCDLSDPNTNNMWIKHYAEKGIKAILVNAINGKGVRELETAIRDEMKEVLEASASKGRIGRTIKCAIVGIPNVGKSSLINKIAGRSIVLTADKPGVTKANSWVRLTKGIELLDTPGVLWPKFDEKVGINLATTGAIKAEILDSYELAYQLIKVLRVNYEQTLEKRFKIDSIKEMTEIQIIDEIGKKRGCLIAGGNVDTERTSRMILDEFRTGKMGNISLERP